MTGCVSEGRVSQSNASLSNSARTMGGAFLVEALVAVLVFSIAAAGVFSVLASATHASTNALMRAAATDLAASTIAHMSVEDLSTLAGRYDPAVPGTGYRTVAALAKRLPGVTDTRNLPLVAIDGGSSAASRRVAITVFWQLPDETRPHRASMTSVIAPR
jgi:type IV pilus assembly protein PilV